MTWQAPLDDISIFDTVNHYLTLTKDADGGQGQFTGARVLEVFEAVAEHQPVGVAALSRMLGIDKSAVQRALVTLAEQGWIQARDDPTTRWETARES